LGKIGFDDVCKIRLGDISFDIEGETWSVDGLKLIVDALVNKSNQSIDNIRIIGDSTRDADNWSDTTESNTIYVNKATWSTSGAVTNISSIQILNNGTIYSEQTFTPFDKPNGVRLDVEWRSTITGDWGYGKRVISWIIEGAYESQVNSLSISYIDGGDSTVDANVSISSDTILIASATFPSATDKTVVDFGLHATRNDFMRYKVSSYDVTDFVEPSEASVSIVWRTTFSTG